MTVQTLAILAAILSDPTRPWFGLEIMSTAGLKSGTLYPALARLERAGMLTSAWEDADPRQEGRPRRRLYELSASGRERAAELIDEHLAQFGAARKARPQRATPRQGIQLA